MYMLLKSVPNGLVHMVNELGQHIKETGLGMVREIKEGNVRNYYQCSFYNLYETNFWII